MSVNVNDIHITQNVDKKIVNLTKRVKKSYFQATKYFIIRISNNFSLKFKTSTLISVPFVNEASLFSLSLMLTNFIGIFWQPKNGRNNITYETLCLTFEVCGRVFSAFTWNSKMSFKVKKANTFFSNSTNVKQLIEVLVQFWSWLHNIIELVKNYSFYKVK